MKSRCKYKVLYEFEGRCAYVEIICDEDFTHEKIFELAKCKIKNEYDEDAPFFVAESEYYLGLSKKVVLKKVGQYCREITLKKPSFDTEFRTYYDTLALVSEIMEMVLRNPWSKNNPNRDEEFRSIDEAMQQLEGIQILVRPNN